MGQILFVRHGQASFGAADYDNLSDIGREQSRLLGAWFGRCLRRVDQVWTGSLRRHQQTAEACLAAMNTNAPFRGQWRIDARLDEFDHKEIMLRMEPEPSDVERRARLKQRGPDARRAFQEMFARATAQWMAGSHDDQYQETWPAFRERCVSVMSRLLETTPPSGTIVVFSSGGPISVICGQLLGLSDKQTALVNWTLVNSGITRVLDNRALIRTTLITLNSYPHLEYTGREELITHR